MSSKFVEKFNIAIRRAEEMINKEKEELEERKALVFWQKQDLNHDYRETNLFEMELRRFITFNKDKD